MPVTPNYSIVYPDGSSQLTPLQTWLQQLAESTDAALVAGLSAAVPVGTTAQRDTFWGVPANATARVLLANRPARWFNTDKGYEQQYFAASADSGAGRFSRTTEGWYPSLSTALFPLRPTSTNGVLDGGAVNFTNLATLTVDGIFSTDFQQYLIEVNMDSASGDGDLYIRGRSAGVDMTQLWYAQWSNANIGGSVTGGGNNGTSDTIVGLTGADGSITSIKLNNPMVAKRKWYTSQSSHSGTVTRNAGGQTTTTATMDGLRVVAGGPTITGTLRVYGVNPY